jgi:hypothetical protein
LEFDMTSQFLLVSKAQSPLVRQAERDSQHGVMGASGSHGTSVLVSPLG